MIGLKKNQIVYYNCYINLILGEALSLVYLQFVFLCSSSNSLLILW